MDGPLSAVAQVLSWLSIAVGAVSVIVSIYLYVRTRSQSHKDYLRRKRAGDEIK